MYSPGSVLIDDKILKAIEETIKLRGLSLKVIKEKCYVLDDKVTYKGFESTIIINWET